MTLEIAPPKPAIVLEVQKAVTAVDDTPENNVPGTPNVPASMLPPVKPETQLVIRDTVKGYVADISSLQPKSPEFNAKVRDIATLASSEMVRTSKGSSRLLEGSSLAGAKRSGDDAQIKVAGTLSELRGMLVDLTPNKAALTGTRKILGFIPGGNKLTKYFERYESAQTQLDAIVKALLAGKQELQKDNAAMDVDRADLWAAMIELNEYAAMARALDEAVVARISELTNVGDVTGANAMKSDVLFAIRQRHQDILTQVAVSIQGYLAMGLIQKNNEELIKGVDRARTTTMQALSTAVKVAKALNNQKLVLDQIEGINKATNAMIDYTAEMLQENTARTHAQAVNSGVELETLTRAFDSIFATMDAIDTFKSEAADSMSTTINSLSAQLERTKPYIDRAREVEAAANDTKQISN